jgi:phosphonate transport system ATP-binding protein
MDAAALDLNGAARDAPATRRGPLLAARALTRRHANGRGIGAIDFAVGAGEFIALVGPSGAGKTTLLRLLAGLDRPQSGCVEFDGATRLARRGDTRVALVFQQPRLIGRLTALDNVLGGRLGHLSHWRGLVRHFDAHDRRLAFASLDRVGLLAHAEDRTDRLSGGEQQRVAIARALVQQPRVLLADEPVASLDPDNARHVMQVLRDCRDGGLAVVASLHQPELAALYADQVVALAAGERVHDG